MKAKTWSWVFFFAGLVEWITLITLDRYWVHPMFLWIISSGFWFKYKKQFKKQLKQGGKK